MEDVISSLGAVLAVAVALVVFFIAVNAVADGFSGVSDRVRAWMYIAPALILVSATLVLPTARTVWLSLLDRRSEEFVGFDNYQWALGSSEVQAVLRNNLLWIVGVTSLSLGIGLLIAVLADGRRFERVIKSLIFMPMAISFVGASVIWRFVYTFRAEGLEQIGLLNAVVVAFGGEPVGWLIRSPWNTLFLIWIMVWMQAGFAMVILSAAIKSIPKDITEAAELDGATPSQMFRLITLPAIRPTMRVVAATIMVLVLKVFDIVKVTTNGEFDTNVLANEMFDQAFIFREFGRGSALAVMLLLGAAPFLLVSVRQNIRRVE